MKTKGLFVLLIAVAYAAVNFVTIGDWGGAALGGYHEADQIAVAKQFAITAEQAKAQFVINTGDNFYYYGVKNVTDKQWNEDFESIYTEPSTMVKWYGVLGNHDYGYNVTAQTLYKSPNNDRWVLPSRYYTKRVEISSGEYISFVFLDTNPCVQDYRNDDPSKWDPCGSSFPSPPDCKFHENILAESCTEQYNWLKKTLATIPNDDWKIAVGHHPGDEIDVDDMTSLLQDAGFELYLNGHTHALAYYTLDGKKGDYVTSGAACMVRTNSSLSSQPKLKLSSASHSYKEVWYSKTAGFNLHTFSDDFKTLTTYFLDNNGKTLYSFVTTKGQAS